MFVTRRALADCGRLLRRSIGKAVSVTNSDDMAQRLDQQLRDKAPKKTLSLQKYHRYLSNMSSQQMPLTARGTTASKEELREFMACFPDIVRDLTESGKHMDAPGASKWIARVLQYNVPSGKKNRGLDTFLSYKRLERSDLLSEHNIRLAYIMGWCAEMFHAHQIIVDDVMDGAHMRRGAPCWYRQPGVGLKALNDAVLVQAAMYSVLKKNFQNKSYYQSVLEMFNEMQLKTCIGQHMDMSMNSGEKPDLSQFTMDKYNSIVKYKASYYTFQMPVGLAMLMAGIQDPETHRQSKTILLEIGQLYQIQDDFLDCFVDPTVTGKVGTDIENGKCTWLAVVALQRATTAQRKVMEDYYGSKDPEDVAKIKNLYEELDLPHTYFVYEEATYNIIRTHIQQITRGLPHDMFFNILEKIFKRDV